MFSKYRLTGVYHKYKHDLIDTFPFFLSFTMITSSGEIEITQEYTPEDALTWDVFQNAKPQSVGFM